MYKAIHGEWGCVVALKKYKLDFIDPDAAEKDKIKFVLLVQ